MQEDPNKSNSFWDFLYLHQSILGILKSVIWQCIGESIKPAFSAYVLYSMEDNNSKK